MKQILTNLKVLMTLMLLCGVSSVWATDGYTRLESIADIDESAQYVLGIDGTGFHYSGTSSWGKIALPSNKTPYYYTLKKSEDGKTFSAKATIDGKVYYLTVPTASNSFLMQEESYDLILGTTMSGVEETGAYAIADATQTTRHIRNNGTNGLRSYASKTGSIAFFYKVVKDGGITVPVTGVSLNETSLSIYEGKTATLSAIVAPNNATNQKVSWTSNNTDVATVADGVVTAVKIGTATITVTTQDGNFTATCNVTVTEVPAQSWSNTYTSNVTLSAEGGTSATTCKVIWNGETFDGLKAGTGSVQGAVKVTVPAGTKTLHFHLAGWNKEEVKVSVDKTNDEFTLATDAGVKGNSPFTLANDPETNDYYTIDTFNAEEQVLTFSVTEGYRFVLFGVNAEPMKSYEVTFPSSGWATLYLDYAATIPAGVKAYIATAIEANKVTLTPTEALPAKTAVLLKGSGTVTFTETAGGIGSMFDLFRGVVEDTPVADVKENTIYVLNAAESTDANPKFSQYTGSTLNANKAYLDLEVPAGANLTFVFGDATGIDTVETVKAATTRVNLAGQVVGKDYKGVVIENGKKFLNK